MRKLRLKKGALDKFQLPVDVLEGKGLACEVGLCAENYLGHLGTFTLSLHWMNLGNQPVEILIEDVYLLVVPTAASHANPEEEERRAQAAKAERLENAELLHMQGQTAEIRGTSYSPGSGDSILMAFQNRHKLRAYGNPL